MQPLTYFLAGMGAALNRMSILLLWCLCGDEGKHSLQS